MASSAVALRLPPRNEPLNDGVNRMQTTRQQDRFALALDSIGDTKWDELVAAARTAPDGRDAAMSKLFLGGLPEPAADLLRAFDDAWAQEAIARETAAFELGASRSEIAR